MDYSSAFATALERPDLYWSPFASALRWFKPWNSVLEGGKWFVNGETNIAHNVLSHEGTALIWYGEDERREITYSELARLTERVVNVMKDKGVTRGDRVAIYMPNLPETIASLLACAKMGVVYSVIFAGLGEQAVKARIQDLSPKLVLTTRYTQRRGQRIPLLGGDVTLERNLTPWEDDFTLPERIEANDPLVIMYTSGTTGRPKGIVLPHGSWMVGHYTVFDIVFSLRPGDVVFTSADVGWITFSRIMYGTLLHGGTLVFMEGAPDHPRDRVRKIMERENPKVFFTSPTLLRLLRSMDLSLPRVEYIATAGEIMDEPSWDYAIRFADRVTDIYGQSETGYVVGTPFSLGVESRKGYAGVPFPGALLETVDENGNRVEGEVGHLVLKSPFPTKFIGVWRNEEKFKEYQRYGGHDTGDLAIVEGGYVKIVGRSDDMIKVAGHRITSGEVEDVVSKVPGVKDASAVGVPDPVKGEKLVLFIVGDADPERVKAEVRSKLGPIYVVDRVVRVPRLPKSRSGKVVRRILRDLLTGKDVDPTILEDPEVVNEVRRSLG
ncbi:MULTISPECIES: AMP-binding protein [Metallosphaera]|uniref:AMP-dependent synthetase and ligase n=3 Tax=Metallosphaera TaxID=41980 RepID=A4YG98_METS5|nr:MULTISPECIES: AMP-binding protein [Metallosphaera]ABP95450.1 AMP-dependent synthetase and ligase [Metallosphaera sedula DSM 5348]AIM27435.1 AMP-dependent synthetase and ligase [Metallosphaera sedula]AKV74308.1 AMP-dependent synthetase [Metallosphaera sedula]AKV76547.1 AMP-dependent synthetase [Metallosphaera sedula]AKV78799.1 AMP-dependent synthetase [Metallosphaera sedula]